MDRLKGCRHVSHVPTMRASLLALQLKLAVSILLFATAATAIAANSEHWLLSLFDISKFPRATCNDGSPSGVWVSPSTGRSPHKVIVHLQGGFWCWDEASCSARAEATPDLVSSRNWPQFWNVSREWSGYWSSDCTRNPGLCEFTVIYVGYCTSDTFSGNMDGDATLHTGNMLAQQQQQQRQHARIGFLPFNQWSFHGSAVLDAVISTFSDLFLQASYVLFAGCSAGGQGVIVSADSFHTRLAKAGFKGRYKAFADAGWMQNVPAVRTGAVSIETQLQKGTALWNGRPNDRCVAANPGRAWVCYVSPVAVSYVESPLLVQSNQFDQFQLPYDCCMPPLHSAADQHFSTMLRDAFRTSMGALIGPSPHHVAFSAACFAHCIGDSEYYHTIMAGDRNLQQVMHEFMFGTNATSAIGSCDGFNCDTGCPSVSTHR